MVILILGWILLRCDRKPRSLSSLCVHIMKGSSTYLSHSLAEKERTTPPRPMASRTASKTVTPDMEKTTTATATATIEKIGTSKQSPSPKTRRSRRRHSHAAGRPAACE
ncbi:hypothetical protein Trydic_g661 [Trypoxylus dichotomus]